MQSPHTGTIKTWHDERGFGFIEPDQGSGDVFVHIKAWPTPTLPEVGERVQYQLARTTDGKVRAVQVRRLQGESRRNSAPDPTRDAHMVSRVAASQSAQQARRQSKRTATENHTPAPPAQSSRASGASNTRSNGTASASRKDQSVHLGAWIAVAVLVGLLGVASIREQIALWLPLVYGGMSLLTYGVYAHDKRAAQQDAWRVSEKHLLLLGLCGGWPGALLAQQRLRHKSSKTAFLIPFWITVLMNLGALAWLGQR